MDSTKTEPAAYDGPVLTEEQRALALSCWRLAHRFARDSAARARADGLPLNREDVRDTHAIALAAVAWAAAKFDPSRGLRFTTYAWHALKNTMKGTPGRLARQSRIRLLGDVHGPAPEEWLLAAPDDGRAAAQAEAARAIAELLPRLDARDADVLRMRHMEGKTRRAVAERLGVSRERVRQIEARAMSRARELMGGEDVE